MLRIREATPTRTNEVITILIDYLHITNRGQHSNRRGEISNYIIECMIINISESVHIKSPLHNFQTSLISTKHQHDITTNSQPLDDTCHNKSTT